jgi:hypothetical protein
MIILLQISTHLQYRAHIVKWVVESNRPAKIIDDRELRELLSAGRPTLAIPSSTTISRDIKICFEKCQEQIGKLLHVCLFFERFCLDV